MSRRLLPFLLTVLLWIAVSGIAMSQETKPLTNQDVVGHLFNYAWSFSVK